MAIIGDGLILASLIGSGLLCWAVLLAGPFRSDAPAAASPEAITLLKPLHGAERQLERHLATFLDQDWPAPIQMICSFQRSDDPGIAIVQDLRASRPAADIDLVVDGRVIGANAKISNLANAVQHARHDLLVLSDSDIAVTPGYFAHVSNGLAQPNVGAVTCLYRGVGAEGIWSRLVALGIDLHFLPSALIGLATGLAHPCMGSTIAFRRDMLDRIGGFAAFADVLADDHAIGAAVRSLGPQVIVLDTLVIHNCDERRMAELVRHELRWNVTIRGIDPAGYFGSILLHPLPLAIIGTVFSGFSVVGSGAVVLALAARMVIAFRLGHRKPASFLLVPLRDLLSFAVFIASWFARSVDWRGARLRIEADGRVSAEAEKSR